MKLKFKKGFDGDLEKLPSREVEGSVLFKEPESFKKFSIIANIISLIVTVALLAVVIIISGVFKDFSSIKNLLMMMIACVISLLTMPVHELLHAICFREEVEFYTYLRSGLMFVVGTESMTKARFIFMSMLPNLVLGFVPFILFLIFPSQIWLGYWGAISIGAGAGDYTNVFNALTQMPKGSLCYMSKNRSYWYMPEKQ